MGKWFFAFLAVLVIAGAWISADQDKRERARLAGARAWASSVEVRQNRDEFTVLKIEEGKIYCFWGRTGKQVPSCVFVPKEN